MKNLTEIYASQLETRLAKNAGMNSGQINTLLGKFNKLSKAGGPEMAFRVLLESYGNEDTEKAFRTIKEAIQQALEKFSEDHAGVDKNPLSRLRELIKRHNAGIKKCSALINGKESLTDAEVEAVKIRAPSFLNREQLQAFASLKASIKELDVEVKF
jgi:hypothetical protein